ncbi:MAG: sulfatase-like hydrolase/transferase [Bryobacterales bacterium]|nr:LTA synthase family protein [Bryobacteraceae bacterium]MDW8355186.1 sulfatase-like hydrolase/transferase [Bryobacterales bacterium]
MWSELFNHKVDTQFTRLTEFSRTHYVAALVGVLSLGFAAYFFILLLRRIRSGLFAPLIRLASVGCLVVPLNALRIVISEEAPSLYVYLRQPLVGVVGTAGVVGLAALLVFLAVLTVWRFRSVIHRLPLAVAVTFLPLLPVTIGQALWGALRSSKTAHPAPERLSPSLPRTPLNHNRRLAWIVFDEWDYRLTFERRPPGVALPELDLWRQQSLFASHALPPGRHTLTSISAMLTGLPVWRVQPFSRTDAWLILHGQPEPVKWSEARSVFRELAASGDRVAVVGWAVPYCRLYRALLAECCWWETSVRHTSKGSTLAEITGWQLRSLVETTNFSPFGQSGLAADHYQTWRSMMDHLVRLLGDPTLHLIFAHLPVPHAPYFYDRVRKRFDRGNSLAAGYLDQLEVVDHSVREIREALQRAGLWDRTAVLLTSDHSFRGARALRQAYDPRIPFVLRFPGMSDAIVYRREFNTIVAGKLVAAILRGALATPSEAADWLERQRASPQLSWRPGSFRDDP